MKKYILLLAFLPLYFVGSAQCDSCTNDVSIGSLTKCSPAFFDLTDIIDSLPAGITGESYNYYEVCNNGNGNLATQIPASCAGMNANKCVTNFDVDEDADNIIYIEVINGGSCDTSFKFTLVELLTPTIAVNNETGPSACGQSNGSITFSFTNVPDGMDTIFWDGGSQVTSINSNLGTIINLDNVTYNNFRINVGGCTSQEDVDVTLMDPPTPTIAINGPSTSGPTTCGGNNGTIALNFTNVPNGMHTVTWTGQAPQSQTISVSNNTGALTNLVAGAYNDLKITVNACTSTDNPDQVLSDPPTPTIAINGANTSNPTTCGGTDGQIALTFTNVPNGMHTVSWNAGAGSQTIAVASNTGVITNLPAGSYMNIKITVNGCTSTQDPDQTLTDPLTPTIAINVSGTNGPTTCGGNNGTIALTFTNVPNGMYSVTWTGQSPESQMISVSNNTGALTNLVAGMYNDLKITVGGCSSTQNPDQTLSDPPTPTIAIDNGNTNDPTTCGGTNGKIGLIFTNVPNGTHTVTWTGAGAQTQNVSVSNNMGALMNLTAGMYNNIKITVAGCVSTQDPDRTLNDPPTPTIAIDNGNTNNPTTCGGSNGQIALIFTNVPNGMHTVTWTGQAPQTQTITVSNNAGALTNLVAGTYNDLKITVSGCTSAENPDRILSDPPTPTIAINNGNTNDPTTCGGNDGQIALTFTNVPNGMHTVSWTGQAPQSQIITVTNNTGALTNLVAGTYNDLKITVSGCTSAENPDRTLNDPSAPNPGTPTGNNPTACGASDGSINIPGLIANTTYLVSYTDDGSPVGPLSLTSNGSGTITISNLNAGLYASFSFNLNNCVGNASGSVTLSDPASPNPGTPTSTNPTNCGGTDGTISIPGLMPNTSYSVSYTDDGNPVGPLNLTSNGTGIVLIAGLNAGVYTAFSFTLNGCNGTNNTVVTLEDPNAPTCSASSNAPICEGTDLQLMASTNGGGASTFQWSGPGGYTSTQQNPIRANAVPAFSGTYNLTVTKNGCECTTSTVVVVHPKITINSATETDPLCNGDLNGSILLNVSGGTAPLTYTWSNAQTGNPLDNLSAGTYTVTITDAGGSCTATNSYTLMDPTAISISNTPIIKSCANEATGSIDISVTGGVSPYNYLWSDNSTSQDLINIGPGTYTVTVTDDNACTKTTSYVVGSFAPINTQITGDLSFCQGTSGTICAPENANYTYEWNDGTTTPCISFASQQTFTVTITQNNPGNQLCEEIVNQTVFEIENPIAQIDSDDPDGSSSTDGKFCLGSVGTLTASSSNNINNLLYEWSTGSFDQNITVVSSGTYTVTISENDSGIFCSDVMQQAITVWNPPAVSDLEQLNSTNFVNELMVFGATIVEQDNPIATTGYSWELLPDGTVQNPPANEQPQLNVIFPTAGPHIVNLTVFDDEGCPSEQNTFPKYVSNPDDCLITGLSFSSNTICAGDNMTVNASAKRSLSASQITSYEYFIDNISQGLNIVNFTGPEFMNTTNLGAFDNPGTYTVKFQIVDNGFPNCTASLEKEFTVKPNPSITIQETEVSGCAGVPIQLNYTIQYQDGFTKPPLQITFNDGEGTDIVKTTPGGNETGVFNIAFEKSGTYTVTSIVDQTDKYCDVIDNFDSFVVNIFDAIEAVEADFECDNTGAFFVYSFEIQGGDGDYSIVSGVGEDDTIELIGGKWIYTSDTLADGSPVNVVISDGSSCTNLMFNSPGANNTCQCSLSSNTGTILVQGGNGNVCESDTVFFSHDFSGIPAELEGVVEIWYYVLRDVPFDPDNLDNIVYFTQNNFIDFPSGDISLDSTYSIMPIIGFPDGTGSGVDFFNTTCLSYEGDAKEFRFFSNPTPEVSVDESIFCENTADKLFEAAGLIGGTNDNVIWSLDGGLDKHFYPSAAEKEVYISFPDSLFTSGETVNITLTENKQYTAVSGLCTGSTTYSFVVSEQAAPDRGEIYWWPGDILVSTIQDACYQWGFIQNDVEQSLTDGDDDRFLFVPGGIAEIDQTETPEKIYFVDIFFKDGSECNLANECKTRTYYNSEGPPQLQIGSGDENEFLVYPNPSENLFNLRIRGEWGGLYRIDVLNQVGNRVQTQELEKNYWTLTGTIDLSGHPAGVYYLVSTNDAGERKVVKIVKTL